MLANVRNPRAQYLDGRGYFACTAYRARGLFDLAATRNGDSVTERILCRRSFTEASIA